MVAVLTRSIAFLVRAVLANDTERGHQNAGLSGTDHRTGGTRRTTHPRVRRRPQPGDRARGRRRRLRPGHLHRGDGALRLRQEHAAADRGRARPAHLRPGVHRRHRPVRAVRDAPDRAASYPDRVRLPGVQPDRRAHRRGEHRAAPAAGRRPSGPGLADPGGRAGRPRRPAAPPAGRALRRPAAAGGDRPGAGHPPRGDLLRRAHRRARLADRGGGADAAARGRGRTRADGGDGDPRSGRRVVRGPRARAGRRRIVADLPQLGAARIAEHLASLDRRVLR